MGTIKALIIKEFLQIRRDPMMIRIIFMVPLIQLFVLGYTITFDVKNVGLVIRDADRSSFSRLLVDKIMASGRFRLVDFGVEQQQVRKYFENGKASLALLIPQNFESDLKAGCRPDLQLLVDGVDSNTGIVASGYAQRIIAMTAAEYARQQGRPGTGVMIEPEVRIWFNPELESKNYTLPGIVAILVMMTTLLLSSLALVREREIGTLEQLSVTPISRWQLMVGKTLPFLVLGFILMLIALGVVAAWYRIPMEGNLGLLFIFSVVFIVCVLSVGLLISTLCTTQQQAVFLAFFFNIFAILTSGLFAPIHNMPEWVQYLTYLNPVRFFMVVVRGIYLKGTGLGYLWHQGVFLIAWAALALSVAVLRFHKQVS